MPIDRGIIDQQLHALGEGPRWWEQPELRDLPGVMHADETIQAIARGKLGRVRLLRRSWLIVVTQKRLLCMRSAGRTGWRQFEVGAGQISRVALRVGPFRGRVLFTTSGRTYRLLVPRRDAYKLHRALSNLCTPAQGPLPGFAPMRLVRRVFDHVLALPAVALGPEQPAREQLPAPAPQSDSATDRRIELLETEAQELREQVSFLEELLRKRQAGQGTHP